MSHYLPRVHEHPFGRPALSAKRRCRLAAGAGLLVGLAALAAARDPQAVAPPPPSAEATSAATPADAADESLATATDREENLPPVLEGMQVVEHLDRVLPRELEFVDQDGRWVRLGDYFDGRRPVILTLNYYRCPMLCGLMLNGLLDGLQQLEWTAGDNFRIVTVSFDPQETHQLAYLKRQNYLTAYGRPAAAGGWDFLTGQPAAIQALLDATGFPVRWNEQRREYVHPACILVITPDARISRYLYGVYYEPRTLRLSLVEAAAGKIGTTVDRILLFCFHYDAAEGRYAVAAMNLMRAGGLLTLVVVGGFVTLLWRRERRSGRAPAPPPPTENGAVGP